MGEEGDLKLGPINSEQRLRVARVDAQPTN
ncbi:uncharacterized protein G2W53_011894 [Senna tora]|uniref:Uncharacterized protein n=1 Tax=Senna tora TaxID=362788 RepID=A0A834TZW1_9FABA|nr:uncharacterized protein G2W53_011894 [Senna tora]